MKKKLKKKSLFACNRFHTCLLCLYMKIKINFFRQIFISFFEERRRPWIVIRSWSDELRHYRNLVRHLDPEQPVITLGPPQGEKKRDFPRTVDRWTEDCLARLAGASAPEPLRLGGWSFGGVLALETARKLEATPCQYDCPG